MLQELMPIYSKDGMCQTIKEYVEKHVDGEINGIKQDIEDLKVDKVDKVVDAVDGNVAGLTASGNIFDTGISLYGEKTYDYAEVLNIKNALPVSAVDCKVKVKPIQSGSGTPSPDNIRPISGIDEVEIEVSDGEGTPTTTTIPLPQTVYDADVDVTNGDVDSRFDIGDIGLFDTTWSYDSTNNRFITGILADVIKHPLNDSILANILCEGLKPMSLTALKASSDDALIAIGDTGGVSIRLNAANGDQTVLKTLLTGIKLCYELATPTTLSFDPTDVELLEGTNVVSANTGDISMTVKFDRLADLEDRVTALENA